MWGPGPAQRKKKKKKKKFLTVSNATQLVQKKSNNSAHVTGKVTDK
jgi:hypothetical protein